MWILQARCSVQRPRRGFFFSPKKRVSIFLKSIWAVFDQTSLFFVIFTSSVLRAAPPQGLFFAIKRLSICLKSILAVFDQKSSILGPMTATTAAAAEEFLAESRPQSHRTQGSHIPFGTLPSLRPRSTTSSFELC